MRHPSYAGFFAWALGTQLLLGNFWCLIAYTCVLYRFFGERIVEEEKLLLQFFPGEYQKYKSQVASGIPLIL